MQISDIAAKLGVDNSTISKDIKFLVRDSQKYLNDMARQTLPFMYKQSIEEMQQILLECWARYRKDGNLFALRLVLDCHKEIFNQGSKWCFCSRSQKNNREGQCIRTGY